MRWPDGDFDSLLATPAPNAPVATLSVVITELFMANLPHGRAIQGSLGVRSLFREHDTSARVVEWYIRWAIKALRNVAAMGPFSADRTIGEYADKIWKCTPLEFAN